MSAPDSGIQAPGISSGDFVRVFPFYFSWDRGLHLTGWGPSLAKICHDLKVGEAVSTAFELIRPEGELGDFSAEEAKAILYLFKHRKTETLFRGQVIGGQENGELVMLCSPWLKNLKELENLEITIADFPIHDPTLDMMQLLQTQQSANQDLKLQADKLSRQRSILRASEMEARKLALVASRTESAVIVANCKGEIEWVNDSFSRLTGWANEEAVGKKPGCFLGSHDAELENVPSMQCELEAGRSVVGEIWAYHKAGHALWVSIEIQPVIGPEGEISNYLAIASDTTRRRLDELRRNLQLDISQALNKNLDETKTITEVLKAVVGRMGWSIGLTWEVSDSSSGDMSVISSYGQHNEPEIEKLADRLLGEEVKFSPSAAEVLSDDGSFWLEKHEPLADAEWVHEARQFGLEHSLAFPVDIGGEVNYIFEFFWQEGGLADSLNGVINHLVSDFSDHVRPFFARKKIESDVLLAKEKAEEANRIKTEFFATISHEIRTPVSGIIGMASMLLDREDNRAKLEMTGSILSSGEALRSIIDDILVFSKIEASGLEIEHKAFSLDRVIDGVVDLVYQTAREKGLEMTVAIGADIPESIVGDAGRFRQILLNLLGNAIKFTDEGEVNLSVHRSEGAEDEDWMLEIAIEDTGVGISEDDQRALFLPFSQVDGSTTRQHGGVGLGLAISQRLAELMGGRISLRSLVGQGSTFYLTVPVGIKESQNYDGFFNEFKELRILYADEIGNSRRVAGTLLGDFDDAPVIVASEEEVLDQLSKGGERWDCLLISSSLLSAQIRKRLEDMDAVKERPGVILLGGLTDPDPSNGTGDVIDSFIFRPLRRTHLKSALKGEAGGRQFSGKKVGGLVESYGGSISALVVEDDEVNAQVAIMYLEKLGVVRDHVDNGAAAIEAFQTGSYDCILLDCHMPVMDGYEVARQIRQIESEASWSDPPVRIIAMTANVASGERERCLAAGMDEYIAKPIRIVELSEVLVSIDDSERGGSADEASSATQLESLDDSIAQLVSDLDAVAVLKLIDTWLTEVPKRIEEFDQFEVGTGEEKLRRIAHSLKGSATIFGLNQFAHNCAELERLFEEGDEGGVLSFLPEFLSSYRWAERYLRSELRKLQKIRDISA